MPNAPAVDAAALTAPAVDALAVDALAGNAPRKRTLPDILAAALVTVLPALIAHLASGGAMPAVSVLAALTAFVLLAAALLAGRPLPFWCLLLLMAVAQQVLHPLFALFADAGSGSGPGLHHGEGVTAVPALPEADPAPVAGHGDFMLMLHLHTGAALLAAVILSRGRTILRPITSVRPKTRIPGFLRKPRNITSR